MSERYPRDKAPEALQAAFVAGQYSSNGPLEMQEAEREWDRACEMFAQLTALPAAPSRIDYEVPFEPSLWRVVVEGDNGTHCVSTFCLCETPGGALDACRKFFQWPPLSMVTDSWKDGPGSWRAESPALCAAYRVNVYPAVFEIAVKVYPVRAIDALRDSYVG